VRDVISHPNISRHIRGLLCAIASGEEFALRRTSRLAPGVEAKLANGAIGSTLKVDDLIEIGAADLFERQRMRFFGQHMQFSGRYHLGLALDLGRIVERHDIGARQICEAPAAGCVGVELGERIIGAPRTLLLRQLNAAGS
jgi:hypothetical protein